MSGYNSTAQRQNQGTEERYLWMKKILWAACWSVIRSLLILSFCTGRITMAKGHLVPYICGRCGLHYWWGGTIYNRKVLLFKFPACRVRHEASCSQFIIGSDSWNVIGSICFIYSPQHFKFYTDGLTWVPNMETINKSYITVGKIQQAQSQFRILASFFRSKASV